MRNLLACLLALLLVACAPPVTAPQPAAGTGFTAVADPRGPAWTWDADPTLQVTLYTDPALPPGLLVQRGASSLDLPVDYGLGPMDLPLIIVGPRADGTPPLAADPSPGLHLLLAGSTEHGCPADDLELDLLPVAQGDRVLVLVQISGVPYLALPADGRITTDSAQGEVGLDAAEVAPEGASIELSQVRALSVRGSSLGDLALRAEPPVPWAQLQGHGDFIEVDFDHSCEATPPQLAPDMLVQVRL